MYRIHDMGMFITVFTTAYSMSLSRAISVEYTQSYPVSLIDISHYSLICACVFQVFSFLQISAPYTCYVFVFFPFVYQYFFLYSLYKNLINLNSELHLRLRIFCIIYIYIFIHLFTFLWGFCPSRSHAYT